MRRRRYIILFVYTAIFVLVAGQFAARDRIDTKGEELQRLQLEARKLHSDNDQLRAEILQKTSFTYLNDTARHEGFVDGAYYILGKGR